jgi:site-specific DNA-cytosine methylase
MTTCHFKNVLSTFDGISVAQIALQRAGITYDNYYASEINEPSMRVTQRNFPGTYQVGDVRGYPLTWLPPLDFLFGGSPCQDISGMNMYKLGLLGDKSSLFYRFHQLWQLYKPKYFFLENVTGNKEATEQITRIMGVRPVKLCSSLVSAQHRNRYYWTNIKLNTLPANKGILLQDILEPTVGEEYFITPGREAFVRRQIAKAKGFAGIDQPKTGALLRRHNESWSGDYVTQGGRVRKLTPIEWERLQTIPDNYTAGENEIERYRMLGDSWTADIIAHFLKNIGNGTKTVRPKGSRKPETVLSQLEMFTGLQA